MSSVDSGSLSAPDAGIDLDISNLISMFHKVTKTMSEAELAAGADHLAFKSIFRELRLANIWRGRGTVNEVLTFSTHLFTCVSRHLIESEERSWNDISHKQIVAIYALHAFYFLQSNDMLVKIGLTLHQLMTLYILLHATSVTNRCVAQMAIVELALNEAFVAVPLQHVYSPMISVQLPQRCAWDGEVAAYFARSHSPLEAHMLKEETHDRLQNIQELTEELLPGGALGNVPKLGELLENMALEEQTGSLTVFPRHEAEPPEEILDDVIEQSVLDRREKLRHKAAVNAVVVDKKPRLPNQRPQYAQPSTSRQYDDDDEGDDLLDRLDDQDDTLDDQLAELEKLSKQCPTIAAPRPRSQKAKTSSAIKVVKTEASLDQQLAALDQLGNVPAVDPPTRRKARASKVKTAPPAPTTPGSSSLSDQLAALEQLGKIPSSKPATTRKPRTPKTVKVVKTENITSLNDQLMALDRLGEMPTDEQPSKPPTKKKPQNTKAKSGTSVKSKEPETLDDQLLALEQLSNTNETQKSNDESSTLGDQLAILDSL